MNWLRGFLRWPGGACHLAADRGTRTADCQRPMACCQGNCLSSGYKVKSRFVLSRFNVDRYNLHNCATFFFCFGPAVIGSTARPPTKFDWSLHFLLISSSSVTWRSIRSNYNPKTFPLDHKFNEIRIKTGNDGCQRLARLHTLRWFYSWSNYPFELQLISFDRPR